MKQTPEQLMHALQQQLRDQKTANVTEAEDIIFKGIVLSENNNLRKIPEGMFKELFLPMFSSKENYVGTDLYNKWIALAGGEHNPVEVYDTDGTLVFIVPQMIDTAIIDPIVTSHGSSHSLKLLIDQSIQETGGGNPLAHAKLYSALKDMHFFNGEVFMKSALKGIEAWNKIFSYYGLPLIEINTTVASIPGGNDTAILEYD